MAERKRKKPSGIRQKFLKRMKKKLVLLFGAIILAFIGLIARVTYINATNGEKYTKIVLDQQEYNSRPVSVFTTLYWMRMLCFQRMPRQTGKRLCK